MPLISPVRAATLALACAALAGTALAGCGDEPPPPPVKLPAISAALPNIPLPPGAELVAREGSADAIQLTLHSTADVAHVADYYRSVFTKGGWKLVSDVKARDGTVSLYAEQNGPPLWVRVVGDSTGRGSVVQLAGAVVTPRDTTAAPKVPPRS